MVFKNLVSEGTKLKNVSFDYCIELDVWTILLTIKLFIMIKPLYKCSQQELYSVCRLGWGACSEHLAAFSAHRAIYSTSHIADQLAAIASAEALPNDPVRRGIKKITRSDLVEYKVTCLGLFKDLVTYILAAFPASEHATRLDMAGQGYFAKADNENWNSVEALNKAAKQFITDHFTVLTARLNMSPAFQAKFELAASEFEQQHSLFLNKGNFTPKQTASKIEQNNIIYLELKTLLTDGKACFKKDTETRQQFVYSRLLYLTGGSGTSGIKGRIVDAVTGWAIEGVEVSVPKKRRRVLTDKEGHYEMLQMASGVYRVEFSKAGYLPIVVEDLEVKVGVVSGFNQVMVK